MKNIIKYIIIILIAIAINTAILITTFKIKNVERTATGELITAEIAGQKISWYYEY